MVFDSQAPIGTGQGVYMSGSATMLDPDEVAEGIAAFSARSVAHGGREWGPEDVGPDSDLRLYRVVVDGHWILAKDGQSDHRVPVALA